MARKGGYSRSTNDEWLKTTRTHYAEAITSAAAMGQDLETWTADAIAHHAYRCELMIARQKFRQASEEAAARMTISPLESDFMPSREPPTITRPGQGSGPANKQPRPK